MDHLDGRPTSLIAANKRDYHACFLYRGAPKLADNDCAKVAVEKKGGRGVRGAIRGAQMGWVRDLETDRTRQSE